MMKFGKRRRKMGPRTRGGNGRSAIGGNEEKETGWVRKCEKTGGGREDECESVGGSEGKRNVKESGGIGGNGLRGGKNGGQENGNEENFMTVTCEEGRNCEITVGGFEWR
jgi:hypothetical protein